MPTVACTLREITYPRNEDVWTFVTFCGLAIEPNTLKIHAAAPIRSHVSPRYRLFEPADPLSESTAIEA